MRVALLLIAASLAFFGNNNGPDDRFTSYTVNPKSQDIQLFWKDDAGNIFKSIQI